jgi:hypothetical protein
MKAITPARFPSARIAHAQLGAAGTATVFFER